MRAINGIVRGDGSGTITVIWAVADRECNPFDNRSHHGAGLRYCKLHNRLERILPYSATVAGPWPLDDKFIVGFRFDVTIWRSARRSAVCRPNGRY